MRKVNLAQVATLKCAPNNLEEVLLDSMEKFPDREWWVDEHGSSVNLMLPRFYYKEGNKEREINVSKSRNQVPCISLRGKKKTMAMACHILSCAAFNENPDPDNLTEADHITDPNDWLLVSQTKLIFNALKHYNARGKDRRPNSWSLQPHMVNYMPSALQWVTPSQNKKSASTPEHKEFKKLVEGTAVEEELSSLTLHDDDIDALIDAPVHKRGEYVQSLLKDKIFERGLSDADGVWEYMMYEDEYTEYLELGEKEYIRKCLLQSSLRGPSLKAMFEGELIKPNGLLLGDMEKWTEEDWSDVIEFVRSVAIRGVNRSKLRVGGDDFLWRMSSAFDGFRPEAENWEDMIQRASKRKANLT